MVESHIGLEGQIAEINRKVADIILNIESEVSIILDDGTENDGGYSAGMAAKECWINFVNIPTTKEEAIEILENPEKNSLDKLGARLFAELYKKRQLQKSYGIKPKEGNVIGYIIDSD